MPVDVNAHILVGQIHASALLTQILPPTRACHDDLITSLRAAYQRGTR